MKMSDGIVGFSPSDLVLFMESPFGSWMERYAMECPDSAPARDEQDAMMQSLAARGYQHEEALEEELASEGRQVVKVSDRGSTDQRRHETLAAMEEGADVIIQARLELEDFGGYSDFLVKVPGASDLGDFHYEVWDTKLASRVKPAHLIQLSCYAEMLEAVQGRRPEYLTVVLGNRERERFRTQEFYACYQVVKTNFLEAQSHWSPDLTRMPDPAESKSWGDWSGYAESLLEERDHLLQVATITRGQVKKLQMAGIDTMQVLAESRKTSVDGIRDAVFHRLQSQAAIQVDSRDMQKANPESPPSFSIRNHEGGEKIGLALLPPHSDADVFFDIEGYPFDEGGLEYLWGATWFDSDGMRQFSDFWAHDREQEKQAFEAFITWVYQRWRMDPSMHIYHYASYEITACRKLMGRFGVCEQEVDDLLRNQVFVDLYKIVKGGLFLGEPRYSIKNVEKLYRNARDTEVGSGGDSVVVYEAWRERYLAGEVGDTCESSEILRNIRDYNRDDCDSTQELVFWLRQKQKEHRIRYLGTLEPDEPATAIPDEDEKIRLREQLLLTAEGERKTNPSRADITENLAWMLEFHRREAKPVFWRYFDRLGQSEEDLYDDLECLVGCRRTSRDFFLPNPRSRKPAYEYSFDPNQEFKGAHGQFTVLGVEDENGRRITVTFLENESDMEHGIIVVQASNEPPQEITLIPSDFVQTGTLSDAIMDVVKDYAGDNLVDERGAIVDVLSRSRPRFNKGWKAPSDGKAIVSSHDPEERINQITHAVKNLKNSYLTIQGPPGAGKTHTGTRVIAELVRSGARVGIMSNSHKAINNLLLSTARYCQDHRIDACFVCTRDTEPAITELGVTVVPNNQLARNLTSACVMGTTVWGFARAEMACQLDYLFIDEAGQVSMANLVAASRATKNIVVMGDQMQLGQPTQGTHPKESGSSILDYLLHETPTIPEDMGIFLDVTWRMHSEVNRFVSEYIYEGKLTSHPRNDTRYLAIPDDFRKLHPESPLKKRAGIVFVPVNHSGNTQGSDEEVKMIQELANSLIGMPYHTGENVDSPRPLTTRDMMFVAPYNYQVNKLKSAFGDHAKIGTIDKFQGQEAPIVFLSLCASDPSESPRGLTFLLDKHRMNVAVSRAQSLVIVVANPAIGQTQATSVTQLALLNLFNALVLDAMDA